MKNKRIKKMQGWVDKNYDAFCEAVLFPILIPGEEYPAPGYSVGESLFYLDKKLFNSQFSKEVIREHEAMEDFYNIESAFVDGGK